MLVNFRAVLRLRKRHPVQVVLLLGNHCLSYLLYPNATFWCAGFRSNLAPRLAKLYQTHRAYFQIAFAIERTLLVHAGVPQKWLDHNSITINKLTGYDTSVTDTVAELLNALLERFSG